MKRGSRGERQKTEGWVGEGSIRGIEGRGKGAEGRKGEETAGEGARGRGSRR